MVNITSFGGSEAAELLVIELEHDNKFRAKLGRLMSSFQKTRKELLNIDFEVAVRLDQLDYRNTINYVKASYPLYLQNLILNVLSTHHKSFVKKITNKRKIADK
jgi:hypothetical protein